MTVTVKQYYYSSATGRAYDSKEEAVFQDELSQMDIESLYDYEDFVAFVKANKEMIRKILENN